MYELEGDKVFTVLRDRMQTKGTESYHEYNTLACAVSFLFDLKQSSVDCAQELATPFDGSVLGRKGPDEALGAKIASEPRQHTSNAELEAPVRSGCASHRSTACRTWSIRSTCWRG